MRAQSLSVAYEKLPREVFDRNIQLATADNAQRFQRLRQLFVQAGCEPAEQPVRKKGHPNLICTLKGETDKAVLVGAHFDAVDYGVTDNWAGASLLPALFQSLSTRKRKHTFVFIGFTDEEKGLLGSKQYVKAMSEQDKARTAAMINLDTLGLAKTSVWITRSDQMLVAWLQSAARSLDVAMAGVNMDQVGSTDSESFAKLKIPRITITSITQETFPLLHTPKDNLSAIKMDHYYDSYRLIALYLALLDEKLPAANESSAAPR